MDASKKKSIKSNKLTRDQKYPVKGKGAVLSGSNPRLGPNPRTNRPNAKASDITAGVVTLTQDQLDAILSTVGSLVSQNKELKKGQNNEDIDGLTENTNVLLLGDKETDIENILSLKNGSRQTYNPNSQEHGSRPRIVEPLDVPGLGLMAPNNVKVVEPDSIPGLRHAEPPTTLTGVPKAHMTQAEKKRLQWERERADAEASILDIRSPIFGIGSRTCPNQLDTLGVSKPATPRAHLTRAERRRRDLGNAPEMPVPPGRTFSDFWSNDSTTKVVLPHDGSKALEYNNPIIPFTRPSKSEIKEHHLDQEKAENDARDAEQNRPPPCYQTRSREPVNSVTASQLPQGGPISKTEQKRLQWEKERAENAARDTVANRPAYEPRAPAENYNTSPSHLPLAPIGGIPKAHLSKAERKRAQWEQEKAEEQGIGGEPWLNSEPQNRHQPPPRQPSNPVPYVPKQGMSKSEMKRLQWEKERQEIQAEQQQEFNPWGRPGAGAPIRDANGQVLSDFNQRKVSREPEHAPTDQGAKPMQASWHY